MMVDILAPAMQPPAAAQQFTLAIGRCLIGLVSDLPPDKLITAKTPQGCFCRLENGEIDWFDVNGDAA